MFFEIFVKFTCFVSYAAGVSSVKGSTGNGSKLHCVGNPYGTLIFVDGWVSIWHDNTADQRIGELDYNDNSAAPISRKGAGGGSRCQPLAYPNAAEFFKLKSFSPPMRSEYTDVASIY